MLNDYFCGVEWLKRVEIQLGIDYELTSNQGTVTCRRLALCTCFIVGADFRIQVHGSRRSVLLSVELDTNSFALLPAELTQLYLAVHPVMFNQGVNQVQTQASILGAHTLQDDINEHSW